MRSLIASVGIAFLLSSSFEIASTLPTIDNDKGVVHRACVKKSGPKADTQRVPENVLNETLSVFSTVDLNTVEDCVVTGSFEDSVEKTGWGRLTVKKGTHSEVNLNEIYFGAGLIEGFLSCDYIYKFWNNYKIENFAKSPVTKELLTFIADNNQWLESQTLINHGKDPYWTQVDAMRSQLKGVYHGYNAGCGKKNGFMTELQISLLNMNGDLFDLLTAFPGETIQKKSENEMSQNFTKKDPFIPTHCSALIKILPDYSDVFSAHVTWDTYTNMYPRIYKHFLLPVASDSMEYPSNHEVHYSSMPGYLSSVDDFYVVKGKANLNVIETSNTVYDKSLYERLTYKSVLSFMRSMVANSLAESGKDWTTLFSKFNSGTYNNQWMVVDLDLFRPYEKPRAGFFHVLEQIPGLCVTKDITQKIIEDTYFGSFNVPFFTEIYNISGYPDAKKKSASPASLTHDGCPRSLLFKDLHKKVTDVKSMQFVMGWDKAKRPNIVSPLVNKIDWTDPTNGISARCDLTDPTNTKVRAYGGIDGKVASYSSTMMGDQAVQYARAGPTNDEQPTFCWESSLVSSTVHKGHVDCFNYQWEEMKAN